MTSSSKSHQALAAAADRLFRSYERHCTVGDQDALFDFLNALHSLGDKVNALGRPNLNPSENFIALRGLRNLYHHEAELLHATRSILTSNVPDISTDLGLLCLVPKTSIDRALKRAKDVTEATAMQSVFHWYGPAVNIEPATFNAMVDVYELLLEKGIEPGGASFDRFNEQYQFEHAAGHSHRVTGTLHVLAGDVVALFGSLLASPASAAKRTFGGTD